MGRNETLDKIFDLVEKNGFLATKYFLCQNLSDDFQLTRDYEVKHLSFSKIYIKSISYEDLEDDEKPKPFSVIENIPTRTMVEPINPIGITEASKYEEFEVIKLSPFGMDQERVLGIDQFKIYNYEKSVRKEHR